MTYRHFFSCFLFHLSFNQSGNNIESHIYLLNEIAFKSFLNSTITLVVSNTSIKNNIATSISHIHIHNKMVIKTLYHVVNVMTTKAKLFIIRCSINQVTNLNSINKIVIITDSIHATKKVFDSSSHSYQIHAAVISNKLRKFFTKSHDN